ELADDGVAELLRTVVVELDIVAGPSHPEVVAACRQLADEVREPVVVWIPASLRSKDGDGVVGDAIPLDEELLRLRVEEREAGVVDGPDEVVELRCEERLAKGVGGDDVEPLVRYHGRHAD